MNLTLKMKRYMFSKNNAIKSIIDSQKKTGSLEIGKLDYYAKRTE